MDGGGGGGGRRGEGEKQEGEAVTETRHDSQHLKDRLCDPLEEMCPTPALFDPLR